MSEVSDDCALEPFTYSENFESGTLGAWSSYPLWQDTAYDPNFRINTIVPGDPNLSLVQKVTPYSPVDNYAGAQKLLDMYMTSDSSISLRFFLKSHIPVEFFMIRLAGGMYGKIDYTIPDPPLNCWEHVTVTLQDFIRENSCLAGKDRFKVNALAVLAKVPDADPDMPFYLGLDDIEFNGSRIMAFQFEEPAVYKLSEWKPYIPKKHYGKGDIFSLKGQWSLNADKVDITIASFTDRSYNIFAGELQKDGDTWLLNSCILTCPEGLYIGTIRAYMDEKIISETEFTLHVAPSDTGGKHPRLWFDAEEKKELDKRIKSERFRYFYEKLPLEAAQHRKEVPVDSFVFDLDQFPDEEWLQSWEAWGSRLYPSAESLFVNALTYAFNGDITAGEYVKDVLIACAKFDNWTHPWQTKRGRFTEHRSGWWAHRLAIAYDLVYDLLDNSEEILIRKAFWDNIVKNTHRMYVVDNDVTGNTSNWISHTAGASLILQAAMFGDGSDVDELEPYFTGAAMKLYTYIRNISDADGAFCEGLGYNNYTFHTLCQSLPAIEKVFNIDMSKTLDGTYKEYIWAGPIKDGTYFFFGDTEGKLNPVTNWAWLLPKFADPLLGWLYTYLKHGNMESNTKASMTGYMNLINKKNENFMDVLYETEHVPCNDPFDENPVKCFRGVGTTVFKSGWEPDDFIFVMRTGAFYNHQHIDQGSFWLSDHGSVFVAERKDSSYYDDFLYQPRFIQPVGHSTILIDGNHQSQRVGDHLTFAGGFHDHAFIYQFLDGEHAAFSSGDIGRLYWGKVKDLKRNVLYLKPRTLLMLDTVVPAEKDADVTVLYQTERLKDISAGEEMSTIVKDGNTLFIRHICPGKVTTAAVETPHYLYTFRNQRPLVREGMLTVTTRTDGVPLVMGNILTTTTGFKPDSTAEVGDGFISGTASGVRYVFSTRPGQYYDTGEFGTDAAAVTWEGSTVFAALCTTLSRDGSLLVKSEEPITCEVSSRGFTYCLADECEVALGAASKPQAVFMNGEPVVSFRYDAALKALVLTLPKGEGVLSF